MARRGTHMGLKSPLRLSTTYGWYIGTTQVTPSAAELNILTGVTGVVAADISNIGGLSVDLDALTSTAAELNILHGVTGVSATNIGYIGGLDIDLDALTSTAAELNILHGVTGVSATNIGYIGGLDIDLDNLTSTAAELNILHGVTGVSATNIGNIGGLSVDLDALTATASELNALDGITSNFTELNMLDGLTALINAETAGWNVNKGRILGFTATVSNVAHGMSGITGLYMFFQPFLGATPETFDGANQAHFFQWETRGTASFDVYGFTASADAGSAALVGLDWLAVGLR